MGILGIKVVSELGITVYFYNVDIWEIGKGFVCLRLIYVSYLV